MTNTSGSLVAVRTINRAADIFEYDWVARASRVLVLASRQNELPMI